MNKLQTFEQFLVGESTHIAITAFIINLILAGVLSYLLGRVYVKYGTSLSNRRMFARNFVPLAMTTMVIITVVKSSLALSLGLVGALSIVRFRAAIKEPEELSFLFLSIALGLGLGADQRVIILIAFLVIGFVFVIRGLTGSGESVENLHLTVSSQQPGKVDLNRILEIVQQHCQTADLRRLDDSKDMLEVSFQVEFESLDKFKTGKEALRGLGDSVRITFLENKGLS